MDLEALAFNLNKMGPIERAKAVAVMVLEARIKQESIAEYSSSTREARIADLESQKQSLLTQ